MPAPAEADLPRLHREIEALRLRNQLDPKRFYKKDPGEGKGLKGLPKFFQVNSSFNFHLPYLMGARLALLSTPRHHLEHPRQLTSPVRSASVLLWKSWYTMRRANGTPRKNSTNSSQHTALGVGRHCRRSVHCARPNGSRCGCAYLLKADNKQLYGHKDDTGNVMCRDDKG